MLSVVMLNILFQVLRMIEQNISYMRRFLYGIEVDIAYDLIITLLQ